MPVLYDFSGHAINSDGTPPDHLMCLMPERYGDEALYFPIRRLTLVEYGNGIEGSSRILGWRELHQKMIESDRRTLKETTGLVIRISADYKVIGQHGAVCPRIP